MLNDKEYEAMRVNFPNKKFACININAEDTWLEPWIGWHVDIILIDEDGDVYFNYNDNDFQIVNKRYLDFI